MFIPSSSTITVQAKFTEAGKKRIFDVLRGQTSNFIAKFGLGDSDANYESIGLGFGVLSGGGVPEASEFKSFTKHKILKTGYIKPGVPSLNVNGGYGIVQQVQLSLGANDETSRIDIPFKTEWPVGTFFNETYKITFDPPEAVGGIEKFMELMNYIVDETNRIISIFPKTGLADDDLETFFGGPLRQNNASTGLITIIGESSNAHGLVYIDFVQ